MKYVATMVTAIVLRANEAHKESKVDKEKKV
jgi:hypothetical protein